MNRYLMQEELGDGTFGTVFRAVRLEDMREVAIKRMKRSYPSWEEIPTLRELRSLRDMGPHKNIVQLQEVIRESNHQLFFIFEYIPDGNLYDFIRRYTPQKSLTQVGKNTPEHIVPILPEAKIRSITSQILEGLGFLHSRGYIHRDMKPENILLHGDTCKLADFGLAKETSCQTPITEYVSTRWYRAPEVLLRSPNYGKPIDLFGLGCIVAELYTKIPLFPGGNEIEQIYLMTQVLGVPSNWRDGINLAEKSGIQLKLDKLKPLSEKVPAASSNGLAFMNELLNWNPDDRPTCEEALGHEFFTCLSTTPPIPTSKRSLPTTVSPRMEKRRRIQDSSPRSIHDLFEDGWTMFPNLPFCYR